MFTLKCYFFKKKKELSVGEVQTIFCPLNGKQQELIANIKKNEEVKKYPIFLSGYKLTLLEKPKIKADLLVLKVTSYVPGEFKNIKPVFLIGENKFLLSNLKWTVRTVLKKDSKAQSFYGPLFKEQSLSGLYIGLSVGALVIFYSAYTLIQIFKYQKIKKTEINKYQKTLDTYQEYYKSIRSVDINSDNFLKNLNKSFYIFLTRKTKIPLLKCSFKKSKKELFKIKNLSNNVVAEIIHLLTDLKEVKEHIQISRKQTILKKINNIIDKVEESL